jgi:adenylate cyclase
LRVGVSAHAVPALPIEPVASEKLSVPLALPDKPSIAVLPFPNMSGEPKAGLFRRRLDVRQVGRDLGVRY